MYAGDRGAGEGGLDGMTQISINRLVLQQVRESTGVYAVDSETVISPLSATAIIDSIFELSSKPTEHFGILSLDTRSRVAGAHLLHIGDLNSSLVSIRSIFAAALLNNAASIIMFHNHPSGDPTPSQEDVRFSQRVAEVGTAMEIKVLDHIIIGDGTSLSLAEKGLL